MKFSGIVTALVTPFKNFEVDFNSLDRLLEWQKDQGVDGLVINGTTAESPTLSKDEVSKIFQRAREAMGKEFPLILGTGSNSTDQTVLQTKMATELGANAALVVVPYYNKPPQRGMIAHFEKVADSSGVPVLLYNVPGRTVVSMDVDTVHQLSQHKNIIGIKEATGDVVHGKKVFEKCGPDFLVTSGDDGSCIDLMLAGGEGVISVISHVIPKQLKEVALKAREKNDLARTDYQKYDNLNKLMGIEANPMPVKAALNIMGIIDSCELRLPMVELAGPHKESLKEELKSLGII